MNWVRLYTEIRSDRKIRRLTPGQRWVWIVLLCLARESSEPGKLLYPSGLPITLRDLADESCVELRIIKKGISSFISQKMLTLNGDDVYTIINWSKRQYDSDNVTKRTREFRERERSPERSGNVPGTPLQKYRSTEVQKDIKTESKTPLTPLSPKKQVKVCAYSPDFLKFWEAYPRKVAKGRAEKIFTRIHPDAQLLSAMIIAIKRAKASDDWLKEDGKYIPHPATWLNDKRWEDQVGEEPIPKQYPAGCPSPETDLSDCLPAEREVDPAKLAANRERLKTIFRDLGQAKGMPG